jgi:hypothetical protein
MSGHDSSGLTIVGGRPDNEGEVGSAISPGLQALLERLAENPSLARDLVANPKTRAVTRGATRGAMLTKGMPSDTDEETRRRRAAQLELVAPFVGDPDFYMGERTRGIRPQSIYPTPFAVAEALLRTSEDFRAAFLADSQQAILTRPDLPLSDEERQMLLFPAIRERLEQVARNG